MPELGDVEFRSYSQNGEDGILLYLFSLLGHGGRRAVEVCASDGIQCNSANLIINHGWVGLLLDGDGKALERGRKFYRRCPTTATFPPKLVEAWITVENINSLLKEHDYTGEIDLFSLDMDGIDYWVWKAIDVISPRVIVLEYNSPMGPHRSVTVPYREDFQPAGGGHAGATLPAFVKLGHEKGYRLIGCQRYGFNAFFLRNDVGADLFREVPVEDCFHHPHAHWCMEFGRRSLAQLEWVEV